MKKGIPLISVIVPLYNTEKYIRQCLLSIINQDYGNIEIVVINDGSTDNSLQIVQELANNYHDSLHVYTTQNSGVSAARNLGIKMSHGEYILFVDADDYLDKDCISYCYDLILNNQSDMAIIPMPNKFHESSSKIVKKSYSFPTDVISGEESISRMLYYKIVISSWGKLFSKKIINKHKLSFNTKLAYGEGFLFTIQYLNRIKKVAIGYKPVYNYRLSNSGSAMTNYKTRLVKDSLASQKLIQAELINHKNNLQHALNYAYWHTCFDCFNTIIGAKAYTTDAKLFLHLRKEVQRNALIGLHCPISKKEKIKSILYFIAPVTTAKCINYFRKRKFTINES